MYVPIAAEAKSLGVLELLGTDPEPSSETTVELLAGMGKQIGAFIERKPAQEALDKMELFHSAFESAPSAWRCWKSRRPTAVTCSEETRPA